MALTIAQTEAELAEWVAVRNRNLPEFPTPPEDVARLRVLNPARRELLYREGGRAVAAALAARRLSGPPGSFFTNVWVDEVARRRGIGSEVAERVLVEARSLEATTLETMVREHGPGRAFAERYGFRQHARNVELELVLAEIEAPEIAAPEGIEITTLQRCPDLLRSVYETALEAWPDVPGTGEDLDLGTFEEWSQRNLGWASFNRESFFLAVAEGEVVGYAQLSINPLRPTHGDNEFTGVRRAWRGRGIAGALKRAQISWAKEAGLLTLETGNEERNEPIRRLNASLGYRPGAAWLFMRAQLRP